MDVSMGYYIGLLITFSILHIVYKFPLGESKGAEAEVFRDQWPGAFMQFTACYTQLMIVVGLCMDGGRSLTGRRFNQEKVNTERPPCHQGVNSIQFKQTFQWTFQQSYATVGHPVILAKLR